MGMKEQTLDMCCLVVERVGGLFGVGLKAIVLVGKGINTVQITSGGNGMLAWVGD